jgi:hypothetical protein
MFLGKSLGQLDFTGCLKKKDRERQTETEREKKSP